MVSIVPSYIIVIAYLWSPFMKSSVFILSHDISIGSEYRLSWSALKDFVLTRFYIIPAVTLEKP